jgi:hypothetical protein
LPDTPTIPEPYTTVASLYASVKALKESVEMLNGQRGDADNITVTWGQLLALGIVKPEQLPPHVRQRGLR